MLKINRDGAVFAGLAGCIVRGSSLGQNGGCHHVATRRSVTSSALLGVGLVLMTAPRSPCTAASVAQAVDTWDATTTDGHTVVLALPNAPTIRLVHRPHDPVSRQTAGRRCLTLSRRKARQRRALVQGDHRPGPAVGALRAAADAGPRSGAGATTGYCPGLGPNSNISKRSPIAGMLSGT